MKKIILNLCVLALLMGACSNEKIVKMSDYGIVPNTNENLSAKIQDALIAIKQESEGKNVTLVFEKGRYDFHTDGAFQKEYYISNHDQPNPKPVGLAWRTGRTLPSMEVVPTSIFMDVCSLCRSCVQKIPR